MHRLRLGALAVAVVMIQLGFLGALRPFDVVPSLVLAMVVLVGLAGTATTALLVAVAAGLILDLASGADFGLRTALFVLVALVAGVVHRAGYSVGGVMVAVALVAAATVVAQLAVLANVASSLSWDSAGVIAVRMGAEIMLNLGGTLLLRPVVARAMDGDPAATDEL